MGVKSLHYLSMYRPGNTRQSPTNELKGAVVWPPPPCVGSAFQAFLPKRKGLERMGGRPVLDPTLDFLVDRAIVRSARTSGVPHTTIVGPGVLFVGPPVATKRGAGRGVLSYNGPNNSDTRDPSFQSPYQTP